ncbi:tRNA-specific adenosine deaminase [Candidatus Micrarchaeota archaeon CG1_02_55_22]|nr:MAG: tRNA-specific adenosine deaminase [Candidatus Micrarchaeota archaeon CG1_02_55_22]
MHKKFLKMAVAEALASARGKGGPFGAVVVKNGRVIGRGHNAVVASSDPTAHAEMNAIRQAAKKLKRFDLSDCVLYSSSEPCPMCLAAVHWAKMKRVYYGASRGKAAKAGFDDSFIYDVLKGKSKHKQVKLVKAEGDYGKAFEAWEANPAHKHY